MNSIDTSLVLPYKWLCIHTINICTHIIDSTCIHIWSHIYIYTYISGSLSHLFHSGWGVCEEYYPFLHLHCPFATVLPICTCITIICTCLTHYLHSYYPFALELPICTCITHYLHLNYPLLALALPIYTWITHLHLHYPFTLALSICTCITHLWFFA